MSFAQERLWFLNEFEGSNENYNIPIILRLEGKLDIKALKSSLNDTNIHCSKKDIASVTLSIEIDFSTFLTEFETLGNSNSCSWTCLASDPWVQNDLLLQLELRSAGRPEYSDL